MWLAAIRTAITWLLGEDILKYAVWFVAGLIAFTVMEAGSFQTVMQSQPWGSWWGARSDAPGVPAQVTGPVIRPVVAVPTLAPLPMAPQQPSERVAAMIANATTWLGVRYLWGGCSRAGVDCSCFVQNVLRSVGITAPRVTSDQIRWARPVSVVEVAAGDLVFFDNTCSGCGPNPTHVGLVLGQGMMIDAGDPVRIEPIYSGHNARYGRPVGL